jgi:Lrp/AsnC family transcriptional regulator for asnA, asnC and gidA
MKSVFNIDKTDVKILQALIKDARSKRKDIANECGLSSTAIKNRIDRMKKSGLIVKPVLGFNMAFFKYEIPLFIGVNLDPHREYDIIKFIKRQVKVGGINKTIGKYDLCLIVFAKSINELDELKHLIRKQKGVKNIELNIYSKKHFNFDNIDLIKNKRA